MTMKGKYTCIFGGGAVRGFAYVGAIKAQVDDMSHSMNLVAKCLDQIAKNHHLVVTMEEGALDGGFGQKVAA